MKLGSFRGIQRQCCRVHADQQQMARHNSYDSWRLNSALGRLVHSPVRVLWLQLLLYLFLVLEML
jgi:hypothetical protein